MKFKIVRLVAVPDQIHGGRCYAPSRWRPIQCRSENRHTPKPRLHTHAQENMSCIGHTQPCLISNKYQSKSFQPGELFRKQKQQQQKKN